MTYVFPILPYDTLYLMDRSLFERRFFCIAFTGIKKKKKSKCLPLTYTIHSTKPSRDGNSRLASTHVSCTQAFKTTQLGSWQKKRLTSTSEHLACTTSYAGHVALIHLEWWASLPQRRSHQLHFVKCYQVFVDIYHQKPKTQNCVSVCGLGVSRLYNIREVIGHQSWPCSNRTHTLQGLFCPKVFSD